MSAVFHVDLAKISSGTGSDSNPFSWSDVKAWLTTTANSGSGTGNYDGTRAYTSNGFDVEFRLRGTADVISATNAIDLHQVNFSDPNQKIVFTCDDLDKYGHPVLRSDVTDPLGIGAAFIKIGACNNPNFEFRNTVIDINAPSSFNFILCDETYSSQMKFHNNTVMIRGSSLCLLRMQRSTNTSRSAFGFNTVLIKSTSSNGSYALYSMSSSNTNEGVLGFCGNNYIARHDSTAFIASVCDVQTYSVLHYGGNRFGGSSSGFNTYLGTGTRTSTGSGDNYCNYTTQGICNDVMFGGTETYSSKNTSVFWPVNAGKLLSTTPNHSDFLSQPWCLGIGTQDANNAVRYGFDAGAFEKNHVPTTKTYVVDLSATGTTENTGSPEEPLTLNDMIRLYNKLSPVVDTINFVLKNDSSVVLSEFDFGPLAPDTTATDRKFSGTGTIYFSGYKTHVFQPPVFRVNALRTSSAVKTIVENIKFDWTTGTDFMTPVSGVNNAGTHFVFRNNIIRSAVACQQSVIDCSTQGPDYIVAGNVFWIQHTTGLGSGIFVMGFGDNKIAVNTIMMPGTSVVGVVGGGTTIFQGNYVNNAPGFTFSGAVLSHNTSGTQAITAIFQDPMASYSTSSWRFTGSVSAPLDIISRSNLDTVVASYLEYDIRGCKRDSSPGGAPLWDAGPYEYSYYVPQTSYYYVDLARTGSNYAGTLGDRWSYEDLKQYLLGLNDGVRFLTTPVQINCINAINAASSISLHDLEASPTGSLVIRSENPFSLAVIDVFDTTPWLDITNAYGFDVTLDSVFTRTRGHNPVMRLSGDGYGSKVKCFNTVMWKQDYICLEVTNIDQAQSGSVVIAGTSKTIGTSIASATTPEALTQNIVNAYNNDAVFSAAGYRLYVLAPTLIGVSSAVNTVTASGPSGITVHGTTASASAVIGASWNAVFLGCGFSNTVNPSANARTVSALSYASGSIGRVAYSSFTGSLCDQGIVGNASVVSEYNALHGYTTALTGVTDTGSVDSPNPITTNALSQSPVITDFTPIGDALDIISEASLSTETLSYHVDYDALRSLRSTIAIGGDDSYDAGPVEVNSVVSTSGFVTPADTVLAGVTAEGYSLNCRRDIDGLAFKIVGYVIGSTGYLKYDPSRVVGFAGSGAQAYASLIVSSNTFNSLDQIVLTFGSTIVSKQYNTVGGWQTGASIAESCANIVACFRADAAFNSVAYCFVVGTSIFFYAKQFGTVGNSYVINATFGAASNFAHGLEGQGVFQKMWPETSDYAVFDKYEYPDPTSCSFVVRLDFDECNKPIGQIVLIAEITESPIPSEIGTQVIYAFANTPLHVKHNREVLVKRVILQF